MAQSRPPYGIPPSLKVTGSTWEQRSFPPGLSDGTDTRWPGSPYRPSDPRHYLIRIAQDWAERDGSAKPGIMYYLEKLPDGYACHEIDQPAGKQVYKRMFGHPSGRFYDSIVRFETHVWWLLDGKQGICECFLCGNYKAPPPGPSRIRNKPDRPDSLDSVPKSSIRRDGPSLVYHTHRQRPQPSEDNRSSRSTSVGGIITDRARRPARGLATAYPVDEEGTRNVWKEGITKVHGARDSRRGLEIDIREDDSTDWLSERRTIPEYFTQVEQQHSFIPRIGELVLWCTSFPEDLFLQRDPASGQYQFYDVAEKKFVGSFPQWRGGIITDVPSRASKNGAVDFTDLLNLPDKRTALNTSGFRVETMSDPNSKDKSLSKQYRYVPLRNIRPLSHWQMLLNGLPQKELHASTLYAITCMTSISVIDKWRLNGEWREGVYVSAKGIHLGSELITIGDTIRLLPESSSSPCADVMVVDTIRLWLDGLREEYLEFDSKMVCSRTNVTFLGKAYTIQPDRAWTNLQNPHQADPQAVSPEIVKSLFRPVGTALYGPWYPLHDDKNRLEVSYDQVLGRLYEAEALNLWSGQRQYKSMSLDSSAAKPDLGFDMRSILAGRRYATKVDERIQGPPVVDSNEIRWVLSDYRAQALDIATFNGSEVGPWFEARTPATLSQWRSHIKISNGEKITPEESMSVSGPGRRERPSYRIQPLEEYDSSQPRSGKRRGRPPGSKLINGKIYRAEDLANMTDIPIWNTPRKTGDEIEIQDLTKLYDYDENEDDMEIAETQTPRTPHTPHKHSSQMAGAALATDSEDIEDDYGTTDEEGERTEADDEGEAEEQRRPTASRSLMAAYGAEDEDEEEYESIEDDAAYLSAWKRNAINSPASHNPAVSQPRPSQPMSKSQIMGSVEQGHGSTLASVADQDDDDGADYEDEFYDLTRDSWKDPRNARGGTEESSGGDYQTDEEM